MIRGRPCRRPPKRFGIWTSVLLPVLLGGIIPASAWSQTPSDRVHEFLESASGFHLLGDIHTAVLEAGQSMVIRATLLDGAEYLIAGFCDQGCSDLNLTIFDPEGGLLTEDLLPDPEPILMFSAESTGAFEIRVDAVECSPSGCDVGVGVLGSSDEPGAPPGEDMASKLSLVEMEFRTQGFTRTDQARRGALGPDGSVMVPLQLEEGTTYRIVGVCDQDCPDLDLALIDPRGIEVDGDFMEDDLPILTHVADSTAEYSLEVIMVACFVEPCAFRVETFSQIDSSIPGSKTFSGELISHETHQGELTEDDDHTGYTYQDSYEVEVIAGQRIVLDLRSEEFDTYLRLVPPEGKPVENDDYAGTTGHSHIEFLAPVSGMFSVQVTSYTDFTTGPYVLQIAVVQ